MAQYSTKATLITLPQRRLPQLQSMPWTVGKLGNMNEHPAIGCFWEY